MGNIFHTEEKEKEQQNALTEELSKKLSTTQGRNLDIVNKRNNALNPFIRRDGTLVNPYINYQEMLDSNKVGSKVKNFITQATGLTPTIKSTSLKSTVDTVNSGGKLPTTIIQPQTKGDDKTPSVSVTGNPIADSAQKYLGTPYVWGGESMEEGGMDCSGFVYNALKDAGYKVGRTTAQGYRSQGTAVSKGEMQPGDLIFFGSNPKNASHIGIYIGNGQMIHSAGGSKNTKNNPGKGVSIVSVDHRKDFLEARRY